jgi:hypothetical protein
MSGQFKFGVNDMQKSGYNESQLSSWSPVSVIGVSSLIIGASVVFALVTEVEPSIGVISAVFIIFSIEGICLFKVAGSAANPKL